jgi:hypothetical protein
MARKVAKVIQALDSQSVLFPVPKLALALQGLLEWDSAGYCALCKWRHFLWEF